MLEIAQWTHSFHLCARTEFPNGLNKWKMVRCVSAVLSHKKSVQPKTDLIYVIVNDCQTQVQGDHEL